MSTTIDMTKEAGTARFDFGTGTKPVTKISVDGTTYAWDASTKKFTSTIAGNNIELEGTRLETAIKKAFVNAKGSSSLSAHAFDELTKLAAEFKGSINHLGGDAAVKFIEDAAPLRNAVKDFPALARAAAANPGTAAAPSQAFRDFKAAQDAITKMLVGGHLDKNDLSKFIPKEEYGAVQRALETPEFKKAFGVNSPLGNFNWTKFNEAKTQAQSLATKIQGYKFSSDTLAAEKELYGILAGIHTKERPVSLYHDLLPDGLNTHLRDAHGLGDMQGYISEFTTKSDAALSELKTYATRINDARDALNVEKGRFFKSDSAIKSAEEELAGIEKQAAEFLKEHPAHEAARKLLPTDTRAALERSSTFREAISDTAKATTEVSAAAEKVAGKSIFYHGAEKLEQIAAKEGKAVEELGMLSKVSKGKAGLALGGVAAVGWLAAKALGGGSDKGSYAARIEAERANNTGVSRA